MQNEIKTYNIKKLYLYIDKKGISASIDPHKNTKPFITQEYYNLTDRQRIPSNYDHHNLYFILKYTRNGDQLSFGQIVTFKLFKEELLLKNKSLETAMVNKDDISLLLYRLNKYVTNKQKHNIDPRSYE